MGWTARRAIAGGRGRNDDGDDVAKAQVRDGGGYGGVVAVVVVVVTLLRYGSASDGSEGGERTATGKTTSGSPSRRAVKRQMLASLGAERGLQTLSAAHGGQDVCVNERRVPAVNVVRLWFAGHTQAVRSPRWRLERSERRPDGQGLVDCSNNRRRRGTDGARRTAKAVATSKRRARNDTNLRDEAHWRECWLTATEMAVRRRVWQQEPARQWACFPTLIFTHPPRTPLPPAAAPLPHDASYARHETHALWPCPPSSVDQITTPAPHNRRSRSRPI